MRFWLGAALMCATVLFAQPPLVGGQEPTDAEGPRARKLDEFGHARGCDHGARLDNFAIELMNNPAAIGYVIAYGPAGEESGTAEFRLWVTKSYLVETRGLGEDKIQTINGGRYKTKDESFVEFWLVPPGAEPPQPARYHNDAGKFKGQFSEFEMWDSFEWGEALGPPVGNSKIAGFAEVLALQPEARAYIVAFNAEESAPGAWRRAASRVAEGLPEYGIAAERIHIIYAGYAEKLKVQLWALPKNAPPPAKDAGAERKPSEAVQVGSMNHYQLWHEEEARSFFRGFAEVLKADGTLTAYLFIRLPSPPEGDEEEPSPHDPQPADMPRLVEDWKVALKKEYGLSEQRLVVQHVAPMDEWTTGEIEAWVVPSGAAPPNPYARPEEDAGEAAAEVENPFEF